MARRGGRRNPGGAGAAAGAGHRLALPELGRGRTPVQVFLVLAGIMFTCYLAAIALLVGAGIALRSAGALADASADQEDDR